LPANSATENPIARLFKPRPYRELFQALADTLDESIVVLSSDGESLILYNHAFLLFSGYASTDLETLTAQDLFVDETGETRISEILYAAQHPDAPLLDMPIRTREGQIIYADLEVIGTQGALVVRATPSSKRARIEAEARAKERRLSSLMEMSALLVDGSVLAIPPVLELAKGLLLASSIGVYRVSSTDPDYIREGPLPPAFPEKISVQEFDPLHRPAEWSIGNRPDHPLFQAARAAGMGAIQTSPLGSANAWVGLLLAGWEDPELVPDESKELMQVIANLCHAGILLGMQRAAIANLEKDFRKIETEFESYLFAVSDGIFELDRQLHVIRANSSAALMLGYEVAELEGVDIQELLIGPPDVMTTLLDVVGHQRSAKRTHLSIHRRDGTPFPVQLRALPMEGESDGRCLLVLSDRSEQKAIEDQTESLSQRALLGEVTAIFAHEVRNPINNISTGIQLVSSRLGKDHSLYNSLNRLRKECDRLNQLMEDVLFFARPLELKFQPLLMSEFVDRIVQRWEPRLHQSRIRLHKTYDPEIEEAMADPRTLEQVIVNLISNAIQAMSAGGTLSIAISPKQSKRGRTVQLKVADTGPGIPPEQLDRIFDPFFTTKKSGTGLGLAISRRIMIAHQGGIKVESFPDAGTVFEIDLPVAEQKS
jgi:PAS domain S-box-containing protein